MSLSGGVHENNAATNDAQLRFNLPTGPGPTRENPAGVYPDVDGKDLPHPGSMPGSGAPDHHGDVRGSFGNMYEFQDTFRTLSTAFTDALHTIHKEAPSGLGEDAQALVRRLTAMRDEIDSWRSGQPVAGADKVEGGVQGGTEGGLFKE